MTRRLAITSSCVALAAVTAGCGGASDVVPPQRPADLGTAKVPAVYATHQRLNYVGSAIERDGLAVPDIGVRRGGIVRWKNLDDRTHRLRSTHGSAVKFRSPPIAPGESFDITVGEPGRTRYRSTAGGEAYRGVIDAY